MTNKTPHTPTYSLTQIPIQGNEQDVFEVYSDDSKEQTLGFVFDELLAQKLVRVVNSHEELLATVKEYLHDLERGKIPTGEYWNERREFVLQAIAKAEGK